MQEMEYEQAPEEQHSQNADKSEELTEYLHTQYEEIDADHAPFGLQRPLQDFFLNVEQDHVVAVYDSVTVGVSDIQQDVNQFIFQKRAFETIFDPEDEVVPAVFLPIHNERLLVPVNLDLHLEMPQLSGPDSNCLTLAWKIFIELSRLDIKLPPPFFPTQVFSLV